MLTKVKPLNFFKENCKFLLGAYNKHQFPKLNKPEVAFFGRSNVGKSSLMNALLYSKKLVKISNTPGKTREINFFNLGSKIILVDLPGYGYAEVSKKLKQKWHNLILDYLSNREELLRVYLLIDARRGIKEIDLEIMNFLDSKQRDYLLIFTKIDKISQTELDSLQKNIEIVVLQHAQCNAKILFTAHKENESLAYKELRKDIKFFF